ncbi:MAG: RagB/SusD family nutrient uptake outer membrane protein [Bacteroidetes bacterium]|nr:RagB/SusD family nutrient uptake outer membrane protein [Bacteroidota bacterium]
MKRVYILSFLSLLLFSCKKALDLNPLDQLSDATYFQSPGDFRLFANQYYGWLKNFTTLPGILDNPHSDGRSDLFGGGGSFGAGTNTVPATESNQGNAGNWVVDYQRIYATNYLLSKAAKYKAPADIVQFVAEAHFFRAYAYFDLLQQYGGVPIVKTLLTPDSAQLYGPRSTRDSVADFIIADLQAAIPGLPVSIATSSADYGRASQMAAQAFLSRVALYEGTWQEFRGNPTRANPLLDIAVAASGAVINSNQYALFGTAASNALGGNSTVLGDSAQKYMFVLEDVKSNPAGVTKSANHEYILSTRYDATLKTTNQNITHSQNTGMNRKIANMFLCKDGLPIEKSPLFQGYSTFLSEYQNRDNRMRYTMVVPYQYYWKGNANYRVDWAGGAGDMKSAIGPVIPTGYGHQKWATERQCPDRMESEDYPVIRYAEVLLNYAEAVYERNGAISDADLDKSLNLVRLRVNLDNGMPRLSNAFAAANGLDMRTEIRRERAIELFDEDFRFDDIKRWHSAATDLVTNVGGTAYENAAAFVSPWPVGILWTGTQYQNGPNAYSAGSKLPKDANGCIITDQTARQWTEKNYLYPIPAQQLSLNPQLVQNPGWSN